MIAAVDKFVMFSPLNLTVPELDFRILVIRRKIVDFPAPLGPIRPTISFREI
jgi:hypothetical protein